MMFYANTLFYLSFVFIYFNNFYNSIWQSNTYLIYSNKFLSFLNIKLLSNILLLIKKVNSVHKLNNILTFLLLLLLYLPVITNLIITQSIFIKIIPYITSSHKVLLYIYFFLLC